MKGDIMKNSAICLFVSILCFTTISAQQSLLPKITLLSSEGNKISASEITGDGHPVLIVYWNLSNKECCKQLESLLSVRDEFLKDYHVKIVGIFIAGDGQWAGLRPLISGRAWDMEVYVDVNAEMERAMCIPQLPFTMLYDPDMQLVCSSIGYCANMEDKLCKKVKECLSEAH
jgi:hypothetical protein